MDTTCPERMEPYACPGWHFTEDHKVVACLGCNKYADDDEALSFILMMLHRAGRHSHGADFFLRDQAFNSPPLPTTKKES